MSTDANGPRVAPTIAKHYSDRRQALPEEVRATLSTRPWGLALSGGGVRSATFCFGLIKALARSRMFHRFDLLSTVSGGGYIGSTVGKLFQDAQREPKPDPLAVEKALGEADTRWFAAWLRANGRYLIPRGMKDMLFAAANFGRNLLAVHVELAFLSLLLGGVLVGIDLAVWQWADCIFTQGNCWQPGWDVNALLALVSQWPTVWMLLIPLAWISSLLSCAYWALPTCKEQPIGIQRGLTALLAVLGALILVRHATDMLDDTPIPKLTGGLALPGELVAVVVALCAAWFFGILLAIALCLRRNKDLDWARNRLTALLSLVLRLALLVLLVGVGDYLAWSLGNFDAASQGTLGVVLALATVALRAALPKIADLPKSLIPGTRRVVMGVMNIVGLLVLGLVVVFWMSVVHRATSGVLFSQRPSALLFDSAWQWLGWLVIPPLLLVAVSSRNREFLNRSSLYTFYRARLVRSYLGAANSQRFKVPADGSASCLSAVDDQRSLTDVTEVRAGDDIPMSDYQPHLSGGPVHLINVCVNQTHDPKGGLFNRDRKGLLLTVGPNAQVSVARNKWYRCAKDAALSLGSWMAISGAAVAPGLGASTRSGVSALLMMSGIRLGYWWDSINLASDAKEAKKTVGKYSQFLSELRGRFEGDSKRDWFLSDGGHFENTGAYALLREECELIVVADCGADPRYAFGDLENLVRKARIDLQADITFLRPKKPDANLPIAFGSLNELASSESEACLAIARINYRHSKRVGHMLIVKPNMCNGTPVDLVNFKADNPLFPQEPTTDQLFSESQWESYFQLGQTLGSNIRLQQLADVHGFATTYFVDDDGAILVKDSAGKQSLHFSAKRLSSRIASTGAVSASISLGAFASIGLAGWQAFNSELDHRLQASRIEPAVLKELSDIFGTLPTTVPAAPAPPDSTLGQMATALLRVGDASCNPHNVAAFRHSSLMGLMVTKTKKACLASGTLHASCEALLDDDKISPCLQALPRTVCFPMYWTRDYASATSQVANCWPPEQDSDATQSLEMASSAPVSDSLPQAHAGGMVSAAARAATGETTALQGSGQQAAVCKGQTIYLQIYGPELRDDARLLRAPWHALKASVPPVEDVWDTARRAGRRPPKPYSVPTVIYHDQASLQCALALQPPDSYPEWNVLPLSSAMTAVKGVIEVWLPPTSKGG
ncbi:Patatin-like phospholipase [compost metagenome]